MIACLVVNVNIKDLPSSNLVGTNGRWNLEQYLPFSWYISHLNDTSQTTTLSPFLLTKRSEEKGGRVCLTGLYQENGICLRITKGTVRSHAVKVHVYFLHSRLFLEWRIDPRQWVVQINRIKRVMFLILMSEAPTGPEDIKMRNITIVFCWSGPQTAAG